MGKQYTEWYIAVLVPESCLTSNQFGRAASFRLFFTPVLLHTDWQLVRGSRFPSLRKRHTSVKAKEKKTPRASFQRRYNLRPVLDLPDHVICSQNRRRMLISFHKQCLSPRHVAGHACTVPWTSVYLTPTMHLKGSLSDQWSIKDYSYPKWVKLDLFCDRETLWVLQSSFLGSTKDTERERETAEGSFALVSYLGGGKVRFISLNPRAAREPSAFSHVFKLLHSLQLVQNTKPINVNLYAHANICGQIISSSPLTTAINL